MSGRQKLILAALALANVVLIGGMAAYVVSHSRGTEAPVQSAFLDVDEVPTPSPCADYLIEHLRWLGGTTRVSGFPEALLVDVAFETPPQMAAPEPEALSQVLWTMLDSLSPAFGEICGAPERVDLSARFTSSSPARVFTVQLGGPQLVGWLQGSLTDEALVSMARYRGSVDAAP
jgi:hypothetical protein